MSNVQIVYIKKEILGNQESSKTNNSCTNVTPSTSNKNDYIRTPEYSDTSIVYPTAVNIKSENCFLSSADIYSVSLTNSKEKKDSNVSVNSSENVVVKDEPNTYPTFTFPSTLKKEGVITDNCRNNTPPLQTDLILQTSTCSLTAAFQENSFPYRSKARKSVASRLKTSTKGAASHLDIRTNVVSSTFLRTDVASNFNDEDNDSVPLANCKKRKGLKVSVSPPEKKVACNVKIENGLYTYPTDTFPSTIKKDSVITDNSRNNTSLPNTNLILKTYTCSLTAFQKKDFSHTSKARKTVLSRFKTSAKSATSNKKLKVSSRHNASSTLLETDDASNFYNEYDESDSEVCHNSEFERKTNFQLNDSVKDSSLKTFSSVFSNRISKSNKVNRLFCPKCPSVSFSARKSQRRHILKFHPVDSAALFESLKPQKRFKCQFCFQQYNNLHSFKEHLRLQHLGRQATHACPICKKLYDYRSILSHFEDSHQLQLETQVLYTDSYKDFKVWRKDIQVKTQAQFKFKRKIPNNAKDIRDIRHFRCILSSNLTDQTNPNSSEKCQSKKVNGFCPAYIKIIQYVTGKCVIYFQPTHLGHTNDWEPKKKEEKQLTEKKLLKLSNSKPSKLQQPEDIVDTDCNKANSVINSSISSNSINLEDVSINTVLNSTEENELKPQPSEKKLYACPICKEKFLHLPEINSHFKDKHAIELETEILEADCYGDFLLWKKDIVKITGSSFVKQSMYQNKKDVVVHYFHCHRFGNCTQKHKGINLYCPASLKVKEGKDGKCFVYFQTTHVGHADDVVYFEKTKKKSTALEQDELQELSFVASVSPETSTNFIQEKSVTSPTVAEKNCDKNLSCEACGKSFNLKRNLKRHVRRNHSENTALIEALRERKASSLNDKRCIVCHTCGKIFNRLDSYKRHFSKLHPNEVSLVKPFRKQGIYNCEHCSTNFRNKKIYRRHVRTEHLGKGYTHTCAICREKIHIPLMLNHFKEAHDIQLETDFLEAETYEDFLAWKEDMERETRTLYIKRGKSTSKRDEYIAHYFHCHRSGNIRIHKLKSDSSKSRGTKKINSYCPANLKVMIYNDDKCFVKFRKTHIGHTNDLGYLSLTKSEKELLARKIAANIPFDTILREVRSSYSSGTLTRLHLLKKQDLENVRKYLYYHLQPK